MKKTGPSLRGRLLGQELARARAESKLTMEQAADYLQVDQSKISRMEAAIYPAQKVYVLALLDLYNVSDEQRRLKLLRLSEDVWRKGWWDSYRRDLDKSFIDYPWLESQAAVIRSFEVSVISGLMQTKAYATAIIASTSEEDSQPDQLARYINLRMDRQRVLADGSSKRVCAVIEEMALRRPTGGTVVMQEQLSHLLTLMKRDNVEIRVLPTEAPCSAALGGPLTLFEMPDPYPDVAYAENIAGRAYIEEVTSVERVRRVYDELHRAALSQAKSAGLIKTILKDFNR